MEKTDNIELRSEKVRHIIGRIPPLLIRTGTTVIALMVIAIAAVVYTVHYPITIEAKGEVVIHGKDIQTKVFVPYKYVELFDEQRTAILEFEGSTTTYTMPVSSYNRKLLSIDGQNYFEATIYCPQNDDNSLWIQPKQKVEALILVSNKTIWQLLGF